MKTKWIEKGKKEKGVYLVALTLFLTITIVPLLNVKAAETGTKCGLVNSSGNRAYTIGYNGHTFYTGGLTIGGTYALCDDPNTLLNSNLVYERGNAISASSTVAKALAWIENGHSSPAEYAIAQGHVWGMSATSIADWYWNSVLSDSVKSLYSDLSEMIRNTTNFDNATDWISNIISQINATTPSKTYYEWTAEGSQHLVSAYPGGDTCSNSNMCRVDEANGKYYGKDGKEVTYEEYLEQCSDIPANECPEPDAIIAGVCEVSSRYSDPESWECIVQNDKYALEGQSTFAKKYCPVYCRETVTSIFPGSGNVYQAGQYFTVGSSGLGNTWEPVSFTGIRECRATKEAGTTNWGIDYEQWLSDYNAIVEQMPEAYDDWQKENARVNNVVTSTTNKEEGNGCDVYEREYVGAARLGTCQDEWGNSVTCWVCDRGWAEGNQCFDDVYQYTDPLIVNTYQYNEVTYTDQGCGSVAGYNASYETTYKDLESDKIAMEQAMRDCSNMNTPYKLNPQINFSYTADPNYSYTGELKSSEPDDTSGVATSDRPGSTSTVYYYECSGNYVACSRVKSGSITFNEVDVDSKVTITEKTATYTLPDGLYRYVSKVDGSVTPTLPSDLAGSGAYIDLGGSVIPISVSMIPGRYNISLNFSRIGHINNSGTAHFDQFTNTSGTKEYSCPINILNDIEGRECEREDKPAYCDEGGSENCTGTDCLRANGIDIIYRTIKLGSEEVAFPSTDGDGREPGANWAGEGVVDTYITNNRGVSGDEVYNLEPLYTITLTPTNIKEIRRYNRLVDDYGDFNLVCDAGTGTRCMSEFIHGTVTAESTSFNFSTYFGGTCANASRVDFMSCADKG